MSSVYRLSKILLKNFKNLEIGENGLSFEKMNILIGPNGSGKSSLIGALKFLKEALAFDSVASKDVSEFTQSLDFLGFHRILDGSIKLPAAVHFGFEFESIPVQQNDIYYGFNLMVQNSHSIFVQEEHLKGASRHKDSLPPFAQKKEDFSFVYYQQSARSPIGTVSYFQDEGRENIQTADLDSLPLDRLSLNMISEALEKKGLSPNLTPVYKVRRQLIESLAGWCFYNANDMNLKEIREKEPKIGPADRFVSPSGNNLPIVFHNLYQEHVDFEDRINEAMASILPGTRKIRAIPSGRLRLTIEWHMEGMADRFYLSDMSDGSVRMLCWAIILLSPELPSLLVIDEPELGLHPAWMRTLADWIESAAEKTQVIVTTHSPDLLDHFTDRPQDILCFKYDGHRHFTPERLSEAALASKLEEGWELGDLYRVGDPAIGGWPW